MARIYGVDLPREKRIEIGLTYLYGIGLSLSRKILSQAQIDPNLRVNALTEQQIMKIRECIEKNALLVEGDLRQENHNALKRLIEIKSYRGLRHKSNLPVRGQCTQHNARTCKGPRRLPVKKKVVVGK